MVGLVDETDDELNPDLWYRERLMRSGINLVDEKCI